VLSGNQAYLYHQSLDNAAVELAELGVGIAVTGHGQITGNGGADRWKILGPVTGDGGLLRIAYLDNEGADLAVDSSETGAVQFEVLTRDTALDIAAGADVRIVGGTHTGLEVKGAGQARATDYATFSGLTVTGELQIATLTAAGSAYVYFQNGVTVEGTLSLAALYNRNAFGCFQGGQSVLGSGEVLLSRENAVGAEAVGNRLELVSQSGDVEILEFGAGITIAGDGVVRTNGGEDRLRVLGVLRGIEDGTLAVERLDNDGATVQVDASAGAVELRTRIDNTRVEAWAPPGGGAAAPAFQVTLGNGLEIRDTGFAMDARLGGAYVTASVFGGLEMDGTLEIASGQNRYAYLYFQGGQQVTGSGGFAMTRGSAPTGTFDNDIRLVSQSAQVEVLEFGAGLTLEGAGQVLAQSGEDAIRILGQVRGTGDGALLLYDIDNAGGTMTVDASAGTVALGERAADAVVAAAAGQTGQLGLLDGVVLEGMTLGIDTRLVTDSYTQVYVQGGLTLGGTFSLGTGPSSYSQVSFQGAQAVSGSGQIVLTDELAPTAPQLQNNLWFDGLLAASEQLVIGAGIEITGEGFVDAEAGDTILLDGTLEADDGLLRARKLAPVEGTIAATDDGTLVLDQGLTLTERATVRVGLSEAGAGRIQITGQLAETGTLHIDVAPDFTPTLRDEFVILTATTGFSGTFDAFQGFDLGNGLALDLITIDSRTQALRVVEEPESLDAFLFL